MYIYSLNRFENGIDELIVSNPATGATFSCIPDLGGMMNKLILPHNGKLTSVHNAAQSGKQLVEEMIPWSNGSILFPFPNRLRNGKYTYNGTEYQFPINESEFNNAIHGCVSRVPFDIKNIHASQTDIIVVLQHKYEAVNAGYPFKAKIVVLYSLSDKGFECETIIENTHSHDIPVGLGWHPYFTLNSNVDNLQLSLPSDKSIEYDDYLVPTGNILSYCKNTNPFVIGDEYLKYGFILGNEKRIAETHLINQHDNLKLTVWQQCGPGLYNYLQVFSPLHRKSVAIEPMTCAPDAFNNGMGLVFLKPNEGKSYKYGVRLEEMK